MERRPIVLSVHRTGSPEFPRYFICDQFLRVWTGAGWTGDRDAGLLFDDSNDACREVQRVLMLHYMDRSVRRFRAPVYVDLFADKELTKEEITRWLAKVSKLLIDSPNLGNGPVEGTLGLCRIEWGEMEEVHR